MIKKIINLETTWISLENNGDNGFINKLVDCSENIFKNSTFISTTEIWSIMAIDYFS